MNYLKNNIIAKFSIILLCCALLQLTSLSALQPGDEVIVEMDRKDINVRDKASAKGKLLYQISANQEGIILKGPVDQNGYSWYLIDWDDSNKVNVAGWTAILDDWYFATGNKLSAKMTTAMQLAEVFFKSRPPKLQAGEEHTDKLIISYKQAREKGLLSLDRANNNLSRALEAIAENDYSTAYLKYKYAIVQLNNTKQFFNETIEISNKKKIN